MRKYLAFLLYFLTFAAHAADVANPPIQGAAVQVTNQNPAGTTSGTGVMMGLGATCAITPKTTGRVLVSFNFVSANSGVTTNTATLKFGTGGAPANAAAPTGTTIGTTRAIFEPAATASNPVSLSGYTITTLTVGAAAWFDIDLAAGATTATITAVDCSLVEF